MNRSRYKQRSANKKDLPKQSSLCISYDEFKLLLTTLDDQQANQLQLIIKNHALVQHHPNERYFTGKNSIINQIRYLIDKFSHQITYLESDMSIDQSNQLSVPTKHTTYCPSIEVTPQNYKSIVSNILVMTALPSNRFQICYSQKEVLLKKQGQHQNSAIIITNRCLNNKKIFMIFEHPHQIIELQTLLDTQIPLVNFTQVLQHLANQNANLCKSKLSKEQGTEIFFFKRKSSEDWLKFIQIINKNFGPDDLILMKFKFLDQLIQHKAYFFKNIRIAFDEDQIRLGHEQITQFKVFENNLESSHPLEELAIELLTHNAKSFRYKHRQLDPISCFNSFLLEERKAASIFLVETQKINESQLQEKEKVPQKQYVYFTFFKKMMEIERNPKTGTVTLFEKTLSQEITYSHYILAIQNIKKHAIINQLPFFLLHQQANQVDLVQLDQLTQTHSGDINKLLAYRYLLNKIKYKLVLRNSQSESQIMKAYQKPFAITFNKQSPVYLKMGKLQSPQILKKERFKEQHQQKGRIIAETHFIKLFIDKCLQDLQPT